MTVKCIVWCCSIFQTNGFCQVKSTLTVILCSVCMEQWTLSRDPVIWNAARSSSGVMASACRESHCTIGEGREVYSWAWVWRSLCESVLSLASERPLPFPLQTSAALWDRLHNRRLHRPLLCYGNYKNPTALTIVLTSMTDCDMCECFPYFTLTKKVPFGVDDRWPPRLSREKRRQTKRWRNRGERKH